MFSTQIGVFLAGILCCYLTIFKLGGFTDWRSVLLGSALFYFNPVFKEATTGIMPDIYVLLFGVVLLILCNQITEFPQKKWRIAALCGLIAFVTMFFKESAIVFIPFVFLFFLFENKNKYFYSAITVLAVFVIAVLFCGIFYYYFTGNFFFKVLQIQNSAYPNACSFELYSLNEKIVRLTYGVWQGFVVEGFYPVIFAALILLLRLLFDEKYKIKESLPGKYFVLISLLTIYFPFSFKGYEPLCFKARHFVFLLPPAVLLCVSFFHEAKSNSKLKLFFIFVAALILVVCIKSSGFKWHWLICFLILTYFILTYLIKFTLSEKLAELSLAGILLLYLFFPLFFKSYNWLEDMKKINKIATGTIFYFPDHDNMMHYRLLHAFVPEKHYYSLEKKPFKTFEPYYEKSDSATFQKGWLIVNKSYTVLPKSFFAKIDSLKGKLYFNKILTEGKIDALYIDSYDKLRSLKSIINEIE